MAMDVGDDTLAGLIRDGLPAVPDRLPDGEEDALPVALWVGRSTGAALWVWREPDPVPLRLPNGHVLPAAEYQYELGIWARTASGWRHEMSCGGEWLGDVDAALPGLHVPGPAWEIRTQDQLGPIWWGAGAGIENDFVVEAIPAVLPSEVARVELRAPDGVVVDTIVPRREYPAVILASEVFPVTPVAIGHRDADLVRADGTPLIGPDNFPEWEEFTGTARTA
jgi:hypothetical protein